MAWKLDGAIKRILFDKDGTLIRFSDRTWSVINRQCNLHRRRGMPRVADKLLQGLQHRSVDRQTRAGQHVRGLPMPAKIGPAIWSPMASPVSSRTSWPRLLDQGFVDGADAAVPLMRIFDHIEWKPPRGRPAPGHTPPATVKPAIRRTVEVLGLSRACKLYRRLMTAGPWTENPKPRQ